MPKNSLLKVPSGLNYMRCKRAELDTFYKQRTVRSDPERFRTKGDVIKFLNSLNENPGVFRFLDLPAEMRNGIYSYLLVRGNGTCKPQILGVSKQVYGETYSILYGHVDIQISLGVYQPGGATDPTIEREVTVLAKSVNTVWPVPYVARYHIPLLYSLRDWPAKLLKFAHVNVKMELGPTLVTMEDAEQMVIIANHELYGCCSFLTPSTKLKTLNIEVTIPDRFFDVPYDHLRAKASLAEALWPVKILPSAVGISLTGAAAVLDKSFPSIRELELSTPSDVLRQCRAICYRTAHLTRIFNELETPWDDCLFPIKAVNDNITVYLNHTASITASEHSGMQGGIQQSSDFLLAAIDALLDVIDTKKPIGLLTQGRLDYHRSEVKRIKGDLAVWLR